MRTCVILCYHKVGPLAEEGRRLNVEPARLRQHLRLFARRGYQFVKAQDLRSPWPRRTVCFTFDDAYASTLAFAPPILKEAGGVGCFYAVAGKVGQTSDWDGALARPLADWPALERAQSEGHEIGNHTLTHPHLRDLPASEQRAEITDAHRILTDHGIESRSFCFPYGSLGDPELLGDTGYRIGLSLQKAIAQETDDPLRLPRIVVAFGDTIPLLLYKVHVRPRLRRQAS
jgi:peptidoglycan/xylan/chitin deacetylase (PgdA/CDA1 family)